MFAFTHAASASGGPEAVRGVPYAPVALVAPADWGAGLGLFYSGRAWDTFELTPAEAALGTYLDQLYGPSLTVESAFQGPTAEAAYLVAGQGAFDLLLAGDGLTATLLTQVCVCVCVWWWWWWW